MSDLLFNLEYKTYTYKCFFIKNNFMVIDGQHQFYSSDGKNENIGKKSNVINTIEFN